MVVLTSQGGLHRGVLWVVRHKASVFPDNFNSLLVLTIVCWCALHQLDSCRRNDVLDVPSASELDMYDHAAGERGRRTMSFRLHGDDGFQCGVMLFVPWPSWNLAKIDLLVQSCWLSRSHMQVSCTSKSSLHTNTNKRVRVDTRSGVVDIGRMHNHLVSSVTSRHLDELRVHETLDCEERHRSVSGVASDVHVW